MCLHLWNWYKQCEYSKWDDIIKSCFTAHLNTLSQRLNSVVSVNGEQSQRLFFWKSYKWQIKDMIWTLDMIIIYRYHVLCTISAKVGNHDLFFSSNHHSWTRFIFFFFSIIPFFKVTYVYILVSSFRSLRKRWAILFSIHYHLPNLR